MPDKKVSELQTEASPSPEMLINLVIDPSGTPANRKATLGAVFANISSNTSIDANLDVTGNVILANTYSDVLVSDDLTTSTFKVTGASIIITDKLTPASSATTVTDGSIFYDDNYIYVKTSTGIKRAALTSF